MPSPGLALAISGLRKVRVVVGGLWGGCTRIDRFKVAQVSWIDDHKSSRSIGARARQKSMAGAVLGPGNEPILHTPPDRK